MECLARGALEKVSETVTLSENELFSIQRSYVTMQAKGPFQLLVFSQMRIYCSAILA